MWIVFQPLIRSDNGEDIEDVGWEISETEDSKEDVVYDNHGTNIRENREL